MDILCFIVFHSFFPPFFLFFSSLFIFKTIDVLHLSRFFYCAAYDGTNHWRACRCRLRGAGSHTDTSPPLSPPLTPERGHTRPVCGWDWRGQGTVSTALAVHTLGLLLCLLCCINSTFRRHLLASPTFLLLPLKPKRYVGLLLPYLPELVDHEFFLIFLMSNFQIHFFFSISPYFFLPLLSLTWITAIHLQLVFSVPKAPPPHCC